MLKISDLDKATRDEFERITSLSVDSLTLADKVFLSARRDYLTSDMKKTYEGMLREEKKLEVKPVK